MPRSKTIVDFDVVTGPPAAVRRIPPPSPSPASAAGLRRSPEPAAAQPPARPSAGTPPNKAP